MNSALHVSDLHFQYPDGKKALRGISFTIDEGECVGLVGPNGSGKSTLLMHLNGILPEELTDSPRISIYGKTISAANIATIRREVGLLFQDPDDQLFCPTVIEDIAFGPQQFGIPENEMRENISNVLEFTDLIGFENRLPHHLSGGEKQRVCLAGILACQPRILALDEPTSNLDPRSKRKLKDLLRSLPATKIIATHDLELVVELCPRTIVLDQGMIIADGPTRQLLGNEELMLAHGLEKPHILRHLHPH